MSLVPTVLDRKEEFIAGALANSNLPLQVLINKPPFPSLHILFNIWINPFYKEKWEVTEELLELITFFAEKSWRNRLSLSLLKLEKRLYLPHHWPEIGSNGTVANLVCPCSNIQIFKYLNIQIFKRMYPYMGPKY